MRTTLSLDDDVVALIERARKRSNASLKETVNNAIRAGLAPAEPRRPRRPFRFPTQNLGECLLPSLDSISEALAIAEGEDYR